MPPDILSAEMSTRCDHLAACYTIQGLLGDFSRGLMESLCCWKVARMAVLGHKLGAETSTQNTNSCKKRQQYSTLSHSA